MPTEFKFRISTGLVESLSPFSFSHCSRTANSGSGRLCVLLGFVSHPNPRGAFVPRLFRTALFSEVLAASRFLMVVFVGGIHVLILSNYHVRSFCSEKQYEKNTGNFLKITS